MVTTCFYHCRGPLEPNPTLPPLAKRQPGISKPDEKAVAYVDDGKYASTPLFDRPQGRELEGVLDAGDTLHIAMGEFCYFPDLASVLREIARLVRAWHARGVRVSLAESPTPAEVSSLAIAEVCESLATNYDTWAEEAGGFDAWAEQVAD